MSNGFVSNGQLKGQMIQPDPRVATESQKYWDTIVASQQPRPLPAAGNVQSAIPGASLPTGNDARPHGLGPNNEPQ